MLGQSISFSLMRALLQAGRAFVTPKIRSKTLRNSLRTVVDFSGNRGRLNIPYYWARYYHDGRGPVYPVYKKWLVWFKDPRKDPRLAQGYPMTRTQAMSRRLRMSPAVFSALRQSGDIIVVKRSGPAKANPFFTEGMRGFKTVADQVVRRQFKELLITEMKRRGIYRLKIVDSA